MKLSIAQARAMGIDVPQAKVPTNGTITRQAPIQVPLRGALVESIWLTLPWPPTNNLYYRHAKGTTYLSAEGKAYRQAVAEHCVEKNVGHVDGRLGVYAYAFPDSNRRQDLDNLWKAILDSLQHAGIYRDDAQIDQLHMTRRDPVANSHIIVNVETR